MAHYMKCPRCDLNYIDADKQEYCDVCLREMRGIVSDVDEDDEEDIPMEVCPICGENMMRVGEKMCDECKKKAELETEEPDPEEDDDEWREYLDDDTDDLDEEMGKLDEAFNADLDEPEEEEEEEEEYHDEDEDLDYVTGDEIFSLSDEDDEDDEDDDKDDDF